MPRRFDQPAPDAWIRNCTWTVRCPLRWNDLARTKRPDVRYCGECQRDVHLVESDEALRDAAARGWCVAARAPATGSDPSTMPTIVGEPRAPYYG
ncbi:MAG: hypothetical protein FJ296_08130 [Planctomycetes bacterium]|nr:hypothetical protein [Planctomycetota bacterium]